MYFKETMRDEKFNVVRRIDENIQNVFQGFWRLQKSQWQKLFFLLNF